MLFQNLVQDWMIRCFGIDITNDRVERNQRFLEEALELVQSLGCTSHEAHRLVDYVYSRPTGHPPQEMGGVMITLAALANANELDMLNDSSEEFIRVNNEETMAKIRSKQKMKPRF